MCSQGGRILRARVLPRVPALVNSACGKALLPIYICPLQRRTLGKMHGFSQLSVEKSPFQWGGPWESVGPAHSSGQGSLVVHPRPVPEL